MLGPLLFRTIFSSEVCGYDRRDLAHWDWLWTRIDSVWARTRCLHTAWTIWIKLESLMSYLEKNHIRAWCAYPWNERGDGRCSTDKRSKAWSVPVTWKSINNRGKYTVMNFIMRQPYRSPDLAWAAIVFCFHLHSGDSTRSMRISAWERKWGSYFVNETLTVLWLRLQSCINEKQILITWIELQSCGRCRTKILIDVLASVFYSQSSMTVRDKVMMW